MRTKTKKYLNYSYLIVVIGMALGTLYSNDFNISEIATSQIIVFISLLIASLINTYTVLKQENIENNKANLKDEQ